MSFIEKISRNQMENPTQFFLFEPVLQLIQYSERHIHQSQSIRVSFQNVLVSDSSGQASLAISNIDPMAGTHSVVSESANRTDYTILEVPTVSLDAFSERHGIESFFFVKIDTEGHDFSVIKGCGQQLRRGKIDFLQFEYNHRWVYSRTYLRDVFEFIAGLDYHLGKLVSDGVELIDCWHPELEIFFETNFVLIRKGLEQIANAQSGGFDKFNTFGLKH